MKRLIPALAVLAALAFVAWSMVPHLAPSTYDLVAFGKLPVRHEGRIKPIDTVARWTLMQISNRSTLGDKSAVQWLLDMVAKPNQAADYEVFRVDQPDIKALLGSTDETRKLYSGNELAGHIDRLNEQFQRAFDVQPKERDLYQIKLVELRGKMVRYQQLATLTSILPITAPQDVGRAAEMGTGAGADGAAPALPAGLTDIIAAYHAGKPAEFNAAVNEYRLRAEHDWPRLTSLADFEWYFHRVDPFAQAMALYIAAFLLACFSWMGWRQPLGRAAVGLLLVALCVHTFGVGARVWIHGWGPVTNLYASAIFIGWGAVIMALVVEFIHRNGIGAAMAAVIGFATLVVAYNLDDGDNLEAVRAVLATNFWLSTHVVCVTLGYAATFLGGFVGIAYLFYRTGAAIAGRLGGAGVPEDKFKGVTKDFGRIIYGIICFATLLSFVGTILGGIWADQSWGRFWGWDPKENGAMLIVLWNVLILHARWGGMVRERGVATLAVFGNIVTGWSWFGVNMLGIGLHSYGFMDGAWFWLGTFMVSQLAIMGLCAVPVEYAPSAAPAKRPAAAGERGAGEKRSRGGGKPAVATE